MSVARIPLSSDRIVYPEIDLRSFRGDIETVDELETRTTPSSVVEEDVMFVALGKDLKESETLLSWVLNNSRGMKICILHVHQKAQKIPMMGSKVPIRLLEEHQIRAYHETERGDMHKILNTYIRTCEWKKVPAEKVIIERDSIDKGILELISEHRIKWLVMGAAANKSYSRKMKEPKSKKANRVRLEAPSFCHIWFICKGNLIYTRESKLSGVNTEEDSPPFEATPNTETATHLRSVSLLEGQNGQISSRSSLLDIRKFSSDNHRTRHLSASIGPTSPAGRSDWDSVSRTSTSACSRYSTSSSSEIFEESASVSLPRTGEREIGQESYMEGNTNDELYDKLEQYVAEAQNSQRDLYEESIKRRKAEKDAMNALRRAKVSETMYSEELRHRKELEEALARGREEYEKVKFQLDEITEEFRAAQELKFSLESQIADADRIVEDLERKMFSAVELLQKYKKERDELQIERDNVIKVAEELRKKQSDEASSSSLVPQFFSEFSFFEIEQATDNFDPMLKIGEGGYGSIYRGKIRHTQVAIKMLCPNSLQGPLEYQQEVNILSKLRHPNIVTLIGACPETFGLIYEYLPNGNLEDRLKCKENTQPLSWQTRIRIAAEISSALIFLHSCRPQGVVHGDLKPSNILLDANFVTKISDFGICRILTKDDILRTNPKGTLVYIDPEFLATGELTPMSDVYSFGIILLELLTGRPALGIGKEVQQALDKGNLKDLLDPTAGDWPFVQAKQLAHLGVSCCNIEGGRRPHLESEVRMVLEPMRVSCGGPTSGFGSEERDHAPSYFVCPIFQEVMQDPVVSADGFTYEAEALKGWLESGHDTSPMTNLKLEHHNLVPNHALRSAIQEWMQQH